MYESSRWALRVALALLPLGVAAQGQPPTEFPADAQAIAGDALRERMSDKVFTARLADNSSWRVEYKANGYVYIDTSRGFRDTGTWRADDNRLCTEWRKATSGCNEVRATPTLIYLKRASGEVVALTTR